MDRWLVTTFRFDATPPLGHPLCGGWVTPARRIESPLSGRGLVLFGPADPVVICTLDWTGLCNGAYQSFCRALADAAHTVPERVVVHCVHQHDAPFVCADAQRFVAGVRDLPPIVAMDFFERVRAGAAAALRGSLASARPVAAIGWAEAAVVGVASNRRLVGLDGRLVRMRSVAPASDSLRRLPVGLVDETIRLIALLDDRRQPLCELWFFAVHPISVSGLGVVNHEFVGDARRRRQQAIGPAGTVLYLTGCAGNVNAGKFISSAQRDCRHRLAQALVAAMEEAVAKLRSEPLERVDWRVQYVLPEARRDLDRDRLLTTLTERSARVATRNRAAFALAFLARLAAKKPLRVCCLFLNEYLCFWLPGEPFVEYQLWAVHQWWNRPVAIAGYCDGGPWYVPTREAYAQGGYEPSVAWCDHQIDAALRHAMLACAGT